MMTDGDLRGIILKKFYEKREGPAPDLTDLDLPESVRQQAGRICDQLAQHGLIEWEPVEMHGLTVHGFGSITALGVDVIEGNASAGIAITIDNRSYSVSGSHNIVGDDNVQVGNITVGQIAQSISDAGLPKEKKDEARSIITRAFEHPAVKAVLGTLAESVTKGLVGSATGGTP